MTATKFIVNKKHIRKIHRVGSSTTITIDPSIVNLLKIDEMTFFDQKPTDNGIIMEMLSLRGE